MAFELPDYLIGHFGLSMAQFLTPKEWPYPAALHSSIQELELGPFTREVASSGRPRHLSASASLVLVHIGGKSFMSWKPFWVF
jgi:hypothetical protein